MTEEQQDGTAPAPEANASSEAPASEQTVAVRARTQYGDITIQRAR